MRYYGCLIYLILVSVSAQILNIQSLQNGFGLPNYENPTKFIFDYEDFQKVFFSIKEENAKNLNGLSLDNSKISSKLINSIDFQAKGILLNSDEQQFNFDNFKKAFGFKDTLNTGDSIDSSNTLHLSNDQSHLGKKFDIKDFNTIFNINANLLNIATSPKSDFNFEAFKTAFNLNGNHSASSSDIQETSTVNNNNVQKMMKISIENNSQTISPSDMSNFPLLLTPSNLQTQN